MDPERESGQAAGQSIASGAAAPPTSLHEFWVTTLVASVFAVFMVVQERILLLDMAEDGLIPYLMWQLLWPLASIALALLMPIRPRIVFLGLVGFLWSLVVIGDAAYYRFFGSVTSLVSAGSAHQLLDVSDSVIDILDPKDAFFPIAFLVLTITALLPRRLLVGPASPASFESRKVAFRWVAGLFVVMGLAARFTPIFEDTHHLGREKWVWPAEHWGSKYSFTTYATTFGLYNYHLRDLFKSLDTGRARTDLTDEHYSAIDQVMERKRRLNALPTPFAGTARGRRIVFVQLEAITHWVLDLEVDGQPVMPFLSAMARRGLSWDFVMDVTSIGRTSDAEFAVMTGLLPDTSRPNSFTHADRANAYLPRTLRDLGYTTSSYHGYKKSFWNRTYTHPVYGFDHMYFDKQYESSQTLGLGVPDQVVYDFLLERLANEPTLSFSFLITLTSHHPFVYTPGTYNELFPSLEPEDGWGLLGPYLRSARYADEALQRFFEEMEKRGLAEDTVFVFYGDHDMGFLATEKTTPGMSKLTYTVAEERVPFIVVMPGHEALIAEHRAAHTTATAGLQDVFPTVMHLLGEPVPHGVMGTNLLVPDELREPVPLPARGTDLLFAFRHAIHSSRGSGPIDPELGAEKLDPAHAPTLMDGIRDQLIVRDLLDHPHYWDTSLERSNLLAKRTED